MLTKEDNRDMAMIPTKERCLNNSTRVALLRLCMVCHNENITREGKMMDLMMTERPLMNKVTLRVVLRMLCKVSQDNPDMVILKENMMLFALLSSGDELTPRKLMQDYAHRLIRQFERLRLTPKLWSNNIKALLGSLIQDHEYNYVFGNTTLGVQMTHWRAQELAREQNASIPDHIITMEDHLQAREQKRLLAHVVKDTKQAEVMEKEDDPDESDQSDQSYSEEEPDSVQFNTLTDFPTQMKIGPVTLIAEPGTACEFSPVKQYERKGGRGAPWTNSMKVQLLNLYLDKAEDPLARPQPGQGARSRAVYRKQVPETGDLYMESAIYLDDGSKVSLESLCKVNTIHEMLGSKGLSIQTTKNSDWQDGTGLVHIMDRVLDGLPRTKQVLEEKKDEILDLAKELAKQ